MVIKEKILDAKISVRDYLQHNVLLFDGAMGTYLGQISHDIAENGEPCELANLHQPDMVLQVHKAYVQAGAMALKTNTFGLNQQLPGLSADQIGQIISRGWQLACQAAEFALPGRPAPFIFADFGPLSALEPDKVAWSKGLVDSFLELGAENFLFETFSDEQGLAELAAYVKQQCPQAFIIASFAVQQTVIREPADLGRICWRRCGRLRRLMRLALTVFPVRIICVVICSRSCCCRRRTKISCFQSCLMLVILR